MNAFWQFALGGAVFASQASLFVNSFNDTGLFILQSDFNNNVAGTNGGAVYVVGMELTVVGNQFRANAVGSETGSLFADVATTGGALWYSSAGKVGFIADNLFTGQLYEASHGRFHQAIFHLCVVKVEWSEVDWSGVEWSGAN